MRFLAGQNFSHHYPFFFCLMGQHSATHYIPNGVDIACSGLQVIVDFNLTTLRKFYPCRFCIESIGIGSAANRNQAVVAAKVYFFSLFIGGCHLYFVALSFYFVYTMRNIKLNSLLLEYFGQFSRDCAVHHRGNTVGIFDDRDFCA